MTGNITVLYQRCNSVTDVYFKRLRQGAKILRQNNMPNNRGWYEIFPFNPLRSNGNYMNHLF
jgi:hypothetical protein